MQASLTEKKIIEAETECYSEYFEKTKEAHLSRYNNSFGEQYLQGGLVAQLFHPFLQVLHIIM